MVSQKTLTRFARICLLNHSPTTRRSPPRVSWRVIARKLPRLDADGGVETRAGMRPRQSFMGCQLMDQRMKPNSFILSIGYGDCWTGCLPTEAAFRDSFHDKWLWVAPDSESRMRNALRDV